MKPVLAKLCSEGFLNVQYIGDGLLVGNYFQECSVNVSRTVALLDSLGLTVHPKKSGFYLVQEVEFLGFLLNS